MQWAGAFLRVGNGVQTLGSADFTVMFLDCRAFINFPTWFKICEDICSVYTWGRIFAFALGS